MERVFVENDLLESISRNAGCTSLYSLRYCTYKAMNEYSEAISKTLRVSSIWRIRQINSYKNMLLHASIPCIFLMNLLDSEQKKFDEVKS